MSLPATTTSSDPAPVPSGAQGAASSELKRDLPLGEILIEQGAITADQLSKALRVQKRMEERKPLGTVLVELGFVSRQRVEDALRRSHRTLTIEQILVNRGYLRAEQLAAATEALGGQSSADVLRHLIDAGTVTEHAYLEAYCDRHDLPLVEVDASMVDRALLSKVSFKYLTRAGLVPLGIQHDQLNIAASQIPDERLKAELQRIYAVPVKVWIAETSRIATAIAALENETTKDLGLGRGLQYEVVAPTATEDSQTATDIVDSTLVRALREGASDVHFDPDRTRLRVRFRIDGQLVRVSDYPASTAPAVLSRLKVLAKANIAERRVHQQGRILLKCDNEDVDVRASFYVTVHGENAVLRLLRKSSSLVALSELGMSPTTLRLLVQEGLEPTTGLLLVTGPTGSGKTTTLYAAVQRVLDETSKVITCEDPVEYLVEGITQCSISERPGLTMMDSLRAILRQDPDVILVGEIRDRESADMAVHCALTGHKVLSTLHTEDSVGALIRLVQMDIEPFLVASTLTAVMAQRLLRRPCVHCNAAHAPSHQELRALGLSKEDPTLFSFVRSRGCPGCHYTGYKGRIGVYELLTMTDTLRDALLAKRSMHEIRRIAYETTGFCSLQEDGVAKALKGLTTLSEVTANCPRQPNMRNLRQLQEMYP